MRRVFYTETLPLRKVQLGKLYISNPIRCLRATCYNHGVRVLHVVAEAVMAKVVLPKSGPADHFWSPKVVRPD